MNVESRSSLIELFQLLRRSQIEIRDDLPTRIMYSTDASIYQIEPLGVAFPRDRDQLVEIVEQAAQYRIPLLARGSGSSLAGQAIGAALILDCSRYLNHILEIDPDHRTATVEPGVILSGLNRAAAQYGLEFGPDPASAERATMGGSLANNASGAHSILYGMAADHLIAAETVLADGSLAVLEELPIEEARRRARSDNGLEARIYRAALTIRESYRQAIQNHWPRTWRRASGYNLNYLIPWSPSAPPQWQLPLPYPPIEASQLNLAPLLAGSEGTLAIIRRATVRLVPKSKHTVLGVLAFSSLAAACDAVPALLERGPSAVELIPRSLIQLARGVPAYASLTSFVKTLAPDGDPAALLAVEFSGEAIEPLRQKALSLSGFGESHPVWLAETRDQQNRVWEVRKVGLGILASRPGEAKSVTIIEDIAVPVEMLGKFVRGIEEIFDTHNIEADFYAHASAGCLHIRPLLKLKTREGRASMRAIASQAVELGLELGGTISGEHGDGLARSEWMERQYGSEIMAAFRLLKDSADPTHILNPGKILDAQPMDASLRYGDEYRAEEWKTMLDFSRQGGLTGAIEMCNGAGVCRKEEGLMCPSFQATREEMHSTRGRANLLRAMITGRFPSAKEAEKAVYQALDLCLACKGCKSECPSAVDMAKLRYEFLHQYYQRHPRRWRDYLFARIDLFAHLGYISRPLANALLRSPFVRRLGESRLGLSAQRRLPTLAKRSLSEQIRSDRELKQLILNDTSQGEEENKCLFLADAFSQYYNPDTGLAALKVLIAVGYRPIVVPILGAGRTMISKGFLDMAKEHAVRLVKAIERCDPQGVLPIVGIEPSEIYTLRDEFLDLLPEDDRGVHLAERAFMIDEFLIRPDNRRDCSRSRLHLLFPSPDKATTKILLHGHCYQKAQPPAADGYPTGVKATIAMLEMVGYEVELIQSTCCGMAGAFGYEAEHYEVSMRIGELGLFPTIRAAQEHFKGDVLVAASGVSCQAQIEDGVHLQPVHPIQLVLKRILPR